LAVKQACRPQKKNHEYRDVSVKLPNGNGRELGIARWENGNEIQVSDGNGYGMEIETKSLKWEGSGTKNLSPHISKSHTRQQSRENCNERKEQELTCSGFTGSRRTFRTYEVHTHQPVYRQRFSFRYTGTSSRLRSLI